MKYTLIYFSAFGETKKLNDYYLNNLDTTEVYDITDYHIRMNFNYNQYYDFIILSFPIYSQNIPKVVKRFIKKLKGKYAIINTTFGSIAPGNALNQAIKIMKKNDFNIIGTSIIATNHCYLKNNRDLNFDQLKLIIEKLKNNNFSTVKLIKQKKNYLANIFPDLRSRLGLKIKINNLCNNCNKCINHCPIKAINNQLQINHHCIRCLKCVNICPEKARYTVPSFFLKLYLTKYQNKNTNSIINV